MSQATLPKILAIPGSTKSKSTALSILKFLSKKYKEKVNIEIYKDLGQLPHFNPELEEQLPDSVLELRKLIEGADGILFVSPEYVFSLPGSLKNLIEWNVSTVLFSNKPVAMIIAAASGKKAFESLELILSTIECSMPAESKLLIQAARGKVNNEGDIEDENTIEKLELLFHSLLKTVEDQNRKPTKFSNK